MSVLKPHEEWSDFCSAIQVFYTTTKLRLLRFRFCKFDIWLTCAYTSGQHQAACLALSRSLQNYIISLFFLKIINEPSNKPENKCTFLLSHICFSFLQQFKEGSVFTIKYSANYRPSHLSGNCSCVNISNCRPLHAV